MKSKTALTSLAWLVSLLLASHGAIRALHHHDQPFAAGSSAVGSDHDHCSYCSRAAALTGPHADASQLAEETDSPAPANSHEDCLVCQILGMPAQQSAEWTPPDQESAFEQIYTVARRPAAPTLSTTWARGPPTPIC